MSRQPVDPIREERITMEIVVDAYDEQERALSWYYYLHDTLAFPFRATCQIRRATSPLKAGQEVLVVGMPAEEECEDDMFVYVRWPAKSEEVGSAEEEDDDSEDDDALAVPLSQLTPLAEVDPDTAEAVADWHYWLAQGYEF